MMIIIHEYSSSFPQKTHTRTGQIYSVLIMNIYEWIFDLFFFHYDSWKFFQKKKKKQNSDHYKSLHLATENQTATKKKKPRNISINAVSRKIFKNWCLKLWNQKPKKNGQQQQQWKNNPKKPKSNHVSR